MIRFTLIFVISLAVSSQALAVKWNNPKSENTDQDASKDNSNYYISFKDTIFEKVGNRIDATKSTIITGDFDKDGRQELIGFKKSKIYSDYIQTKNRLEKKNDDDYWLEGSSLSQSQSWKSKAIWIKKSKRDDTFSENWKVTNVVEDSCIHPQYIIPAHLNEDNVTDFVVACTGYDAIPFPGEHSVVILSNGPSSYITKKFTETTGFYHDAATADFNNDGKLDILLAARFQSGMHVYLNEGNGSFKKSNKYFSRLKKYKPFSTEILDVNNDGYFDIFIAGHEDEEHSNRNQETIILLGNQNNKFSNNRTLKIPKVEGYGVVLDIIKEGEHLFVVRTGSNKSFYKGSVIQQLAIKSMKNIALLEVKDMYYLDRIFRTIGKDGKKIFGSLLPHNDNIDFVIQDGTMKLLSQEKAMPGFDKSRPEYMVKTDRLCSKAVSGSDWNKLLPGWVEVAKSRGFTVDMCKKVLTPIETIRANNKSKNDYLLKLNKLCSAAISGAGWNKKNFGSVALAKKRGISVKMCKMAIEKCRDIDCSAE